MNYGELQVRIVYVFPCQVNTCMAAHTLMLPLHIFNLEVFTE